MDHPEARPEHMVAPLDVLFVSGDIGGNVPPTLAIAAELAHRGHRVTIAGLGPRPGERWPEGITSLPLRSLARLDVTRTSGPAGHAPALAHLALGRALAREVRALLPRRSPDVAVVDGVMLASLRETQRAGIPNAALFHSLGVFWDRGLGHPAANALLRPFGLAPRRLLARTDALLLPTDRELDPAGAEGSRFTFDWLGTTETGFPPEPRAPGEPPLVLVSLSTAWQRGQGDVYRRIVAALGPLADDGVLRAIVTTGGAELDGTLEPVPGVEIRARSPHGEIMPRAELVIGHGGHSTTLRALAHGVPILILPLDRPSDQPTIGRAVADAGAGRTLSRDATSEEIAEAVREMLADRELAATAGRIGTRLRDQRGAAAGADRIEAVARRGR